MKTILFLNIIFLVFLYSCTIKWEDAVPVGTYPGNMIIHIVSPKSSELSGKIYVNIHVFDDEENNVSRVELIVDSMLIRNWFHPPYEVNWHPDYEDLSTHQLFARAYDMSDNIVETAVLSFTYRKQQVFQSLKMSALGKDTIVLSWDDVWDNESEIILEESIRNSADTSFKVLALLPSNSTSYLKIFPDTALAYSFRIKASVNNSFSPYSNEVKIRFSGANEYSVSRSFGEQVFDITYLKRKNLICGWRSTSKIVLWDLNGVLIREFDTGSPGNTNYVDGYAVSKDENIVVTSSAGKLKLWNTDNASLIQTINAGSPQYFFVLSSDNTYLTSASGSIINIWELATGTLVKQFITPVSSMLLNNDNSELITGNINGIQYWSFPAGNLRQSVNVNPKMSISSLIMNNNGTETVSAGHDIKIWSYPDGNLQKTLSQNYDTYLSYNMDCTQLLSCNQGGVDIWDLNSFSKKERIKVNYSLSSAVFGPDNSIISAGDLIRYWEKTGRWIQE